MTIHSRVRGTPHCLAATRAGTAAFMCSILLAACTPKPSASNAPADASALDKQGESAPVATPGAVSTEFDPQDPMRNVRLVSEDRAVWMQLLRNHDKIRRTLIHREEGDLGIVEAITESDEPAIAALIIDHARSMQMRMKAGARVRIWDPVFRELFDRHELVELEVVVTEKGVRIVESSRDPETIALLRSHAMGVSDFVREGPEANRRETVRLPVGAPLPPSEVAIGGVPHRFLLAQPSAEQLLAAREEYRNAAANGTTLALKGRSRRVAASDRPSNEHPIRISDQSRAFRLVPIEVSPQASPAEAQRRGSPDASHAVRQALRRRSG